MKILFCLSHIQKSLQWLWFAEELKSRRIGQVYLLVDTDKNAKNYFYEDLQKLNLPVYRCFHSGKNSYIKNILLARTVIRKHKPDIVHTSLPLGNMVGQSAALLCGMKNRITTCENASWAHDFKSKKQEWIDRFTFRVARRIIATSDIAAAYLEKHWQFDKSKLRVIYHGLKPSDYEVSRERIESLQAKLTIQPAKEFVVGVVSRFEFWKGHEFIIEAARLLLDDPEIKIYVFGSKGSYYDEAMKKIAAYDLQQKVIYGGFVEDTAALYQLFDVHLHVPVNEYVETGGITIIEGMMAKRPQVLTRAGYAYQIARHMENAYVVPFKNSRAIADGIRWVKNNPVKAQDMAATARNDALTMFELNKKVNSHLNVYNQLLR